MTRAPDTPLSWTSRFALLAGAVFVVLRTVATAPAVQDALMFTPGSLAASPWSPLTFWVVHTSALHLLLALLALALVGPAVERRLGSGLFALYFLYCSIGAAILTMALGSFLPIPPLAGMLAPLTGGAFAMAVLAGDDDISLEPLPLRARLSTVVVLATLALLILGAAAATPALSVGHLGAMGAGWLFFRLRTVAERPLPPMQLPVRRPVMTPIRLPAEAPAAAQPESRPVVAPEPVAPARDERVEVDRLLDKIGAHGLDSLTPDERRLLDEYAERRRHDAPPAEP